MLKHKTEFKRKFKNKKEREKGGYSGSNHHISSDRSGGELRMPTIARQDTQFFQVHDLYAEVDSYRCRIQPELK